MGAWSQKFIDCAIRLEGKILMRILSIVEWGNIVIGIIIVTPPTEYLRGCILLHVKFFTSV